MASIAAAVLLAGCGERAQDASPPTTATTTRNAPVASGETTAAPTPRQIAAPKLQLPTGITPLAYQLDLTVIPERGTFSGRARIDIRFDAATDGFWIHGRGLEVDKVSLHAGGTDVAATYEQATRDGVVRISLAQEIAPQTAQLDISYHARFSNLLEGLFHERVDGDWYAFTQFEPIDARGAFPGFADPLSPREVLRLAGREEASAASCADRRDRTLPDDTKARAVSPTCHCRLT
jgi:hypothetical protein